MQIRMCGFRAYKNLTRPEAFHEGVNGLGACTEEAGPCPLKLC